MNSSMRFASSGESEPIARKSSMCRSGITSRCTSAFGFMSSIARNPSVRFTIFDGSLPATMLQKMQSGCGGNDALLADRGGADAHELADGRVHEPRRVVGAVAAARTVDEH